MLLDQRLRDYQSKTLPKSKWKIRHNLKAQTHYSSTLLQESPTHWSTRTQRKVFWWTQGTGRCPARTLWGNWDRRRLQKIRSFRQNLRLWFFSGSFGCEENRQLRCNRQLRSREGLSFWFFFFDLVGDALLGSYRSSWLILARMTLLLFFFFLGLYTSLRLAKL